MVVTFVPFLQFSTPLKLTQEYRQNIYHTAKIAKYSTYKKWEVKIKKTETWEIQVEK